MFTGSIVLRPQVGRYFVITGVDFGPGYLRWLPHFWRNRGAGEFGVGMTWLGLCLRFSLFDLTVKF